MAYLTFTDLEEQREEIVKGLVLNEALEKTASLRTKIFLSHRHKDSKIVDKVIDWLKKYDTDSYIDKLDYSMPDQTDGRTAIRIKKKIRDANKFILLATPNSLESKWMPWELGFGDAIKGLSNVAILPLLLKIDQWKEREYYQIYGSIETSDKVHWCFFPPNKKGTRLEKWLVNNSLSLKGLIR